MIKYLTILFCLFQENKSYGNKPFAFILWCTNKLCQAQLVYYKHSVEGLLVRLIGYFLLDIRSYNNISELLLPAIYKSELLAEKKSASEA
jgi:hypothetical protein